MGQGALAHLTPKEISDCKALIARHEGKRSKPYLCTADKITIGIGRNLEDKGLNDEEISFLFKRDCADALHDAARLFASFETLDSVRKIALIDMAFNLGYDRLSQFKNMRAAIEMNDWNEVANQAMDSRWYRQVGIRGKRIVEMLRTGRMPE